MIAHRTEQIMTVGNLMKTMVGMMLGSALVLGAAPAAAQAAAPGTAVSVPAATNKLRCKNVGNPRYKRRCIPILPAEPAVARSNGFLPFVAIPAVVGSAAVAAAAANSKNCGKGNNSQNNGNCPASP